MVRNILTLDIEDWGQSTPDLFGRSSPREVVMPTARVANNTRRLLAIMAEQDVRATCFILGSVAEMFPDLVREIQSAGHEIATHGYGHQPVYTMTRQAFTEDVRRAKAIIEDVIGEQVQGYRAPYFSITRRAKWALGALAELGLAYDASILPVYSCFYRFPGWDGWPDAERFPHVIEAEASRLLEIPMSTVRILGQNLPFAGGAYLRLVPTHLLRAAARQINVAGYPAVFYLHPHDLDAEELRVAIPGETLRIRAMRWALNVGRAGNEERFRRLLTQVPLGPIQEWRASDARLSDDIRGPGCGPGGAG